jgi:hypothetical protein
MIAVALSLCASAQVLVDDDDDSGTMAMITTHVNKSYVLSVGAKAGVNYSLAGNPDGLEYLGVSGNVGYFGGVVANFRFARPAGKPLGTERFGVQLEALYSLRSLKTNTENINMNSFEVPLMLQWYALPSFYVQVGPTFTGVLSTSPDKLSFHDYSKTESTSSITEINNYTTIATGDLKPFDVMLSIGVGYKHKSGLTADLRYNMGTSDLAGNFSTKVSTISLSVGWLFNIVK